ncbi:MAG: hypothetical protein UY37_C0007G0034 [Candidatus Beckwithbacteria bacterium GW2011_GWC2_49_11]|nr:MAG: hypothetical protein UX50_C0007G0016 [Candidatus Beckwithbacteria bacterium GW2011_GWA1_46_30]KKU71432.1 MAG: hypothetical protein UX97_C0006G0016 [Candidatus Beckwithbacteria bacterium GW2011_GWA2_47_25]KKW03080.1 MAG: hypothetical protein UY37_C0007G0034 [Candidatus Beckwithbacteria bacterium GW2011_GWC2_49_11]
MLNMLFSAISETISDIIKLISMDPEGKNHGQGKRPRSV